LAASPAGALSVPAEPYPFPFDPAATALVASTRSATSSSRAAGVLVIHTREGHRPDLADCPPAKLVRGGGDTAIGTDGPNGRILVRGEHGHDIIDELAPAPGEVVLDKPGKGAFYATDLELMLRNRPVSSLIVTGVTTEVCVHTTVREANDRGFECFVPADCVGSYFPEFHAVGLKMIAAQGGIFGWVGSSADLVSVLGAAQPAPAAV
jgi:biuret amidohydrolase